MPSFGCTTFSRCAAAPFYHMRTHANRGPDAKIPTPQVQKLVQLSKSTLVWFITQAHEEHKQLAWKVRRWVRSTTLHEHSRTVRSSVDC